MHIGIDLGTTFSCVAFIDEGGMPKLVPDNKGNLLTPSVIWFKDKTAYVGDEANKRKITINSPIQEYFKRDIGETTGSAVRKEETTSYVVDGVRYGAIGMSAILLRKLKKDVYQYFKRQRLIDEVLVEKEFKVDAVITVPAYFGDKERRATKCAGELAGLNVIGIVNEPTAASLTYGVSLNENKKIMVFDLGGGTFDVTILDIIHGDFKVIATDGNSKLGGKDWDDLIIDYIKDAFKRATNTEIPDDLYWYINDIAIRAKKELSDNADTTVLVSANEYDVEILLHRNSPNQGNILDLESVDLEHNFYFDERSSSLLSNCAARCYEVLEKSGLSWSDLDEIVLAGGSSRMDMIPKLLEKLSGRPIRRHREGFNYDTAIAIGAAIYGQSKGRIVDVTPKSIGIKLLRNNRDEIDHIIYKDTSLPAKAQKVYQADPFAVLELYEGESRDPFECDILGKLELENTLGHTTIILEVDENGILNVLADYQPEGIKEKTISGSGLCPFHLKERIQSINIIS